ncbi:MAG: cysteine desulfurase [Acidobacteria bacterium]|nr:cysteine desulfurase [Acidobacteriota bacterium]
MDHHATTPVLPEVLDAMLPFLKEDFGNASSTTHLYGKRASDAVEAARRHVADLFSASPSEIVFTSGATESDNLAIRGAARAARAKGDHIVTCAIEHEAVLETCHELESEGFRVTRLPVDRHGWVDPESVLRALTPRTILVSIHAANNEIGTIEPIADIGRIARERGLLFHTDAAQAAGRIPLDVEAMSVDLLAMSAHKMYGPKGVGALYVRKRTPLEAQVHGGGQEKKRRSGTLNVPGIVGLGKAAEVAMRDMTGESARLAALRDDLWRRISSSIEGVTMNGHPVHRLPNNLNVTVKHAEGEAMLMALRDAAALSTGSACASGAMRGSYVLRALGVAEDDAHSALRFGLGRSNTAEQIETIAGRLQRAVARLRALSPFHEGAEARGGATRVV